MYAEMLTARVTAQLMPRDGAAVDVERQDELESHGLRRKRGGNVPCV